jgi:hypothetical protein
VINTNNNGGINNNNNNNVGTGGNDKFDLSSSSSYVPHFVLSPRERDSVSQMDVSSVHDVEKRTINAMKLRGLRGIYVAHNDPKNTFWGLMPLFSKAPKPTHPRTAPTGTVGRSSSNNPHNTSGSPSASTRSPAAAIASTTAPAMNSSANSLTGASGLRSCSQDFVENFQQYFCPDDSVIDTLPPSQSSQSQPHGPRAPVALSNKRDTAAVNGVPEIFLGGQELLFVNDGTHQIPLFQGIPPKDMIFASDPFAWLVGRLASQISRRVLRNTEWSLCIQRMVLLPLAPLLLLMRWTDSRPRRSAVRVAVESTAADEQRQQQQEIQHTLLTVISNSDEHSNNRNNVAMDMDADKRRPSQPLVVGLSEHGAKWFGGASSTTPGALLPLHADKIDENLRANGNSGKRRSKKKKKKTKRGLGEEEELMLSPGCSAIVRVIDPRVKGLVGPAFSVIQKETRTAPRRTDSPAAAPLSPHVLFQDHVTNDILYIMSHFAVRMDSPDDNASTDPLAANQHQKLALQFDNKKFKAFSQEFRVHNPQIKKIDLVRDRNYGHAIPDTVDKDTLVQEVNNKFYDILSS